MDNARHWLLGEAFWKVSDSKTTPEFRSSTPVHLCPFVSISGSKTAFIRVH